MKYVACRKEGVGAKALGYLLALMVSLGAATTAEAATTFYYNWQGQSGSAWYETANNWKRSQNDQTSTYKKQPGEGGDGNIYVMSYNQGSGKSALYKYNDDWANKYNLTIKFGSKVANNVYGGHFYVRAGTADKPLVFWGETPERGLRPKSDSHNDKNIQIGDDIDAWLKITQGYFTFNHWKLGDGDHTGALEATGASTTVNASDTVYVNNGSLTVNSSASFTAGRFYVGNASDKTGTLTINSGTVKTTGNYSAIGYAANSTGVVTIGFGATFHNDGQTTNPNLTVGHNNGSSGTLNIQGGTMRLSGYIALAYNDGTVKSDLNVTDGGVLEVGYLYKNQNVSGVGTLTVDGGTIKAHADNDNFIWSQYGLEVAVGAGGATLDTDGHDITVNAPVVDASGASGGLTVKGGGSVTLTAENTYTGATTIHAGTTLKVNDTAKSALVARDVKVVPPASGAANDAYIVAQNTNGTAFTQADLAKFSVDLSSFAGVLVPARLELATVSSENDAVRLVVDEAYNFITVTNRVTTSPTLTGNDILVGAGGYDLETLSIPANGKLMFDPVKTSVHVYGWDAGNFAVGEGAKIALTPNYSGMTLGRIVLLTYKEAVAELPENLNDIFDATSIAPGATWAVTSEDAPDASRQQLVLTVGDYDNDAKEIRILPVGDSITQGVAVGDGDTQDYFAQYRSTIAARLAASGYKPKMLGVWKRANYNASHVMIPEDWAWHCGISAERIVAGGNRGGIRENMHVYLDIAGDVNAITLLAGTNDLGNGAEAADLYVEYTNLVAWTAAQRPNAKIIGAAILDRSNATARQKIVQFNALLRADFQAGNLPANFVLLDLDEAVPLEGTGNFYDGLHLTWKGCVAAGESFAGAIMDALPLTGEGAISGAADASVTNDPQTALGAAAIDDLAAYRADMTHIYTIDKNGEAGATNCFTTAPYTATENAAVSTRPVTKAGYFMELVRKGTSRRRWVWVDFDATGKTLDEIDFPWEGANMDFVAEKLHVLSNDPSIHTVAANDDTASGVVEGTKWNYNATADNDGVPADVSDGYGWNDTLGSSGGHGGFQIHRILSDTEAEVLFAWNCWGANQQNQVDEIGIGTFAKSTTLGGDFSMDYTFVIKTTEGAVDTLSSDAYSVRRFEIWAELVAARPNIWTGFGGDGDFDNAANWEDGVVPSAGADIDFSGLSTNATITVAGASANGAFGNATMGGAIVTFTGGISFTNITDTAKIAVGANATVTLDGDLMFTGSGTKYVVYKVDAGGKFIVTGKVGLASGAAGDLQAQDNPGTGIIVAGSLVNDSTGNWIYVAHDNNATTQYWAIGPGGITGTATSAGMWVYSNNKVNPEFQPNTNDFTVSLWTVLRENAKSFTYNTTGLDGLGHTITLDAGFSDKTAPLYVTGTGKVVVNHVTKSFGGKNAYSGPVTVKDSATLAINAGKKLTTGAITVNSGAALEVAQSGTVALGGNLTLKDGAVLAFNYTVKGNPELDLSGTTVTFDEGETANVVLKVSATAKARPSPGRCVLTTGGKFTGATVTLSQDAPQWVKSYGVDDDGNIYIEAGKGLMIILR